MGLFDMFKKNKADKGMKFIMPIKGEVIKIDEIPDPVFAGKMMGDGFGIMPAEGKVYAPVDGEVSSIFPTGHAVGLKVGEDIEILIHFGLDTVNLKGEGFTAHVKQGDVVKAGDLLIEVDLDAVKGKVPSIATPVVFPKLENKTFEVKYQNVEAKEEGIVTIK